MCCPIMCVLILKPWFSFRTTMIHRHVYVRYILVLSHGNATCSFFSFSLLCVLVVMFWLVVKRMVQCVYEKNVFMYLFPFFYSP